MITLSSCIGKIFTRMLALTLGRMVEEKIFSEARKSQVGFSSDQHFVVGGMCNVRKKKTTSTYMAFLDLSMAYDSCGEKGSCIH